MNRVLLAFFGTREVEIAAKAIGDREIGLLNPPQHFLVELFLKGFGTRQNGIGISIFCVEVRNDVGILFFAEPGVMVNAAVAVEHMVNRLTAGERRLRGSGFGSWRVLRKNWSSEIGVRLHGSWSV